MRERLVGHGHAERGAQRLPSVAGLPLDEAGTVRRRPDVRVVALVRGDRLVSIVGVLREAVVGDRFPHRVELVGLHIRRLRTSKIVLLALRHHASAYGQQDDRVGKGFAHVAPERRARPIHDGVVTPRAAAPNRSPHPSPRDARPPCARGARTPRSCGSRARDQPLERELQRVCSCPAEPGSNDTHRHGRILRVRHHDELLDVEELESVDEEPAFGAGAVPASSCASRSGLSFVSWDASSLGPWPPGPCGPPWKA